MEAGGAVPVPDCPLASQSKHGSSLVVACLYPGGRCMSSAALTRSHACLHDELVAASPARAMLVSTMSWLLICNARQKKRHEKSFSWGSGWLGGR